MILTTDEAKAYVRSDEFLKAFYGQAVVDGLPVDDAEQWKIRLTTEHR